MLPLSCHKIDCLSNDASPCGDMMLFASLKMMLLHFVPQWCDVCPMCRQAHIIRRSRHHWRSQHHLPQANIIQKSLICLVDKLGFFVGGGCGIRTHVGVNPNGFQDRLVMTASITLRNYYACRTYMLNCSKLLNYTPKQRICQPVFENSDFPANGIVFKTSLFTIK